jgi:hypothetical protein
VLDASEESILQRLPEDALVLDVGGWGLPFTRADWVLDMFPYETRGLFDYDRTTAVERFTADTWVQRDICDHEPWPFADRQFDFVVCSQTLEDLRDPIWVCRELQRVAKAGYVEVPAAVEELTWGVHGPWVGWTHHHWITEPERDAGGHDGLRFTFKPHLLTAPGRHLAAGTLDGLPAEDRVVALWWEGTLPAREQVLVGADDFDAWLGGLLDAHGGAAPAAASRARRRWRR